MLLALRIFEPKLWSTINPFMVTMNAKQLARWTSIVSEWHRKVLYWSDSGRSPTVQGSPQSNKTAAPTAPNQKVINHRLSSWDNTPPKGEIHNMSKAQVFRHVVIMSIYSIDCQWSLIHRCFLVAWTPDCCGKGGQNTCVNVEATSHQTYKPFCCV